MAATWLAVHIVRRSLGILMSKPTNHIHKSASASAEFQILVAWNGVAGMETLRIITESASSIPQCAPSLPIITTVKNIAD